MKIIRKILFPCGLVGLLGLLITLFIKDIVSFQLFLLGLAILLLLLSVWVGMIKYEYELSIVKKETNLEEIPSDFEMMFKTMTQAEKKQSIIKRNIFKSKYIRRTTIKQKRE